MGEGELVDVGLDLEEDAPVMAADGHLELGGKDAGAQNPHDDGAQHDDEDTTLLQEVWSQVNLALPTAVGNMFEYLPVVSALSIVGHLPATPEGDARRFLDAVALGRAYFNCTAMAPGFGLLSACRTLMPQAVGAEQPELNAAYAQQAFAMVGVAGVLFCAMQFFAEELLVLTGQDPEVARLAESYCIYLIPTYIFVLNMTILQRVMQAHRLVYQNLVICVVVGATAPGIQYLACYTWGFGYRGAAVGGSICNSLFLLLQIPYLVLVRRQSYLFRPQFRSALAWPKLRHYLALAVPGFFANVMEWWVFEVAMFMSGLLRNPDIAVAANAMATTVQAMFLMAWIGLLVAAAVSVGQAIGSGNVAAARRSSLVAGCLAFVTAAAGGLIVSAYAEEIAAVYTADAEIQALGASVLQLLSVVLIIDAFNNTIGGIMSGLGKQRESAVAQMTGYYVVGMPVGAFMAFSPVVLDRAKEGVMAIWAGIALSMLTSASIQLALLSRLDWRHAAEEAAVRLKDSGPQKLSDDDGDTVGLLSDMELDDDEDDDIEMV